MALIDFNWSVRSDYEHDLACLRDAVQVKHAPTRQDAMMNTEPSNAELTDAVASRKRQLARSPCGDPAELPSGDWYRIC